MTLSSMTSLWARTALCWFLGALCFGLYLGFTGQFQFGSSHAHVGLLGWVSSGLFALLYALAGGESPRGARLHWAAHNLGALGMVSGLYLVVDRQRRFGPSFSFPPPPPPFFLQPPFSLYARTAACRIRC